MARLRHSGIIVFLFYSPMVTLGHSLEFLQGESLEQLTWTYTFSHTASLDDSRIIVSESSLCQWYIRWWSVQVLPHPSPNVSKYRLQQHHHLSRIFYSLFFYRFCSDWFSRIWSFCLFLDTVCISSVCIHSLLFAYLWRSFCLLWAFEKFALLCCFFLLSTTTMIAVLSWFVDWVSLTIGVFVQCLYLLQIPNARTIDVKAT